MLSLCRGWTCCVSRCAFRSIGVATISRRLALDVEFRVRPSATCHSGSLIDWPFHFTAPTVQKRQPKSNSQDLPSLVVDSMDYQRVAAAVVVAGSAWQEGAVELVGEA